MPGSITIKRGLLSALLCAGIFFFLSACKDEIKDEVNFEFDPEVIPLVNTDSVTILISDSGLVKYKVITQTWEMYEQAKEPYWLFPDKLYLEQYDSLFNVIATVEADTVWQYTAKKLWKLRGNVYIRNSENKTFESDEFYWDQKAKKMYSNRPVTITSPGEAIGIASDFESDEQMKNIKMRQFRAPELYINEDQQAGDEKDREQPE